LAVARVLASDVSEEALAIARQNVSRHGLSQRVTLCQADAAAIPDESIPSGGFDVIVSNPPYIAENERECLPRHIRNFEPSIALFGGASGLDVIRRIAAGAGRLLKFDGLMFVEIASGQERSAGELFTSAGWRHERTIADMAGIPRVLVLGRPA
ncbi:MAG TPA: methyltransferase domain-containing protein, partial [Candidatus Cybelea sp.]|nr:methyltransferase domain-containing protein [Candidatus Cybelea sp.]